MTSNNLGCVVSGTLIEFPDDNTIYIVGEIYVRGTCKLYSLETNQYKGEYKIEDIKLYVR